MQDRFITITGFGHYYDKKPFSIGGLVRCTKEPTNPHDSEAIRCTMPMIGTVGYVANSPTTVACGTMSAGRIYDSTDKSFFVRVIFMTGSKIICKIETNFCDDLESEYLLQSKEAFD